MNGPFFSLHQEFSQRHPTITFSHAFPGSVATPIGDNLPLWAKALFLPTKPFQITPEQCASRMCHGLAHGKFQKKGGWYLFDQYAGVVKPTKHQTPEARGVVWDHATSLTDKAAATTTTSPSGPSI